MERRLAEEPEAFSAVGTMMTGKTRTGRALTALLLLVAIGIAPRSSRACINATGASENVFFLHKATAALESGDYLEGRRLARRVLGNGGDADERERASWIEAMTFVRDRDASREDLLGAVATMREVRSHRTLTDVPSRVDLAEALTRLPEGRFEALAIFRPLVHEDLIGSPHAYAALGQIADDPALAALAVHRCQTIADDPSFCARGFVPRRSDAPDRWMPRLLGGLGVLAISSLLLSFIGLVVHLRRRSTRMATLANLANLE